MIRFDWMQDMLEWFDYYLKDIGEQPGQWIEIQSNQGSWRIEERYLRWTSPKSSMSWERT